MIYLKEKGKKIENDFSIGLLYINYSPMFAN